MFGAYSKDVFLQAGAERVNKDNILKIIYKHLGPLEWNHKDVKRGILNLVNNS